MTIFKQCNNALKMQAQLQLDVFSNYVLFHEIPTC